MCCVFCNTRTEVVLRVRSLVLFCFEWYSSVRKEYDTNQSCAMKKDCSTTYHEAADVDFRKNKSTNEVHDTLTSYLSFDVLLQVLNTNKDCAAKGKEEEDQHENLLKEQTVPGAVSYSL